MDSLPWCTGGSGTPCNVGAACHACRSLSRHIPCNARAVCRAGSKQIRRTNENGYAACRARKKVGHRKSDTLCVACCAGRKRKGCTADKLGAVCRARKSQSHHTPYTYCVASHVNISSECAASQGVVLAALLQLTNSPYDELHFGRGSRRAQLSFVSNKECVILGPSRTCGQ